jgi:hypothetical protein
MATKKGKTAKFKIDETFLAKKDSFDIIEPVLGSVRTDKGLAGYEADLARWSKPQRLVMAMHLYLSEVNNGGHDQFFWNSSGLAWSDAAAGFRAVKCANVAKLIDESVKRLGGAPDPDQVKRDKAMQKLEPEFDDLDDRFYDIDAGAIEGKIKAYILKQPEAFLFDGSVATAA